MRYPKEYYANFYNDFFQILPRFREIKDKVQLIYAGANNQWCFSKRLISDICEEIQEGIDQGKEHFIFENSSETFMVDFYLKVVSIAKRFPNIPKENFYYATGCFPLAKLFYDHFQADPEISLLFTINQVLRGVSRVWDLKDKLPQYKIAVKPKLFLCYNKIERPHRIYTYAYLSKNKLLDKGFFSFQGVNTNWIDETLRFAFFPNWVKDEVRNNRNNFPYVLNITEERNNPIDITEDDFDHFNKSYFSILNETTCFSHSLKYNTMMQKYINMPFLTDKTVKALVMRHPFIVNAPPYFLACMRRAGFKTFHPLIDETYDEIEDDLLRIDAVCAEISRLCEKTNDEWLEWQYTIKDILEHNYKLAWEMTDLELKKEHYGF